MRRFKSFVAEGYNGDGDCMQAAANLMMQFHTPFFGKQLKSKSGNPVLVHALVYGQGPIAGKRFPHAWVEDGDEVLDHSNGRKIQMNKAIYYAVGKIDPKQKGAYKKYTYEQMKKKLLSTKHYGHWDLDVDLEEVTTRIGKMRKPIDRRIINLLSEAIVSGVGGGVRKAMAPAAPVKKVEWNELKRLESMLDNLFASAKLDINFTKHFLERINGSRGYGGTVTMGEIQDAFNKTFKKYAKEIQGKPVDWKAVINDVSKNLNMPFTLDWDSSKKSMVILTAMKKPNFASPDPKLRV